MKKIRRVDPSVYSEHYYLNDCLGSEEFKKSQGTLFHPRVEQLLQKIEIKKGMNVLDVGCGRGDIVFFCAGKGANAVGIDYSPEGIKLAGKVYKKQKKAIKRRASFHVMDAKKLTFPDNTFDVVISVDVFEHLYAEELEIALSEISRVLKPQGTLLVHTEANKLYLNYTHRFYTYPVSTVLLFLNSFISGTKYGGLPRDPRNDLHKLQHVNEPTYFYLRRLFKRHHFQGSIYQIIGMLKPVISWKDRMYNCIVLLSPLSYVPPLIYFFAYDYLCVMKNKKQ